MVLVLIRSRFTPKSTVGRLYINGAFECWTLEDTVRKGEKIDGATAIPAGHYPVSVTYSPRFKKDLPLVEAVRGFEGIRFHPGNTAEDTEGCILVGQSASADSVHQSQLAFAAFFSKVNSASMISLSIIEHREA